MVMAHSSVSLTEFATSSPILRFISLAESSVAATTPVLHAVSPDEAGKKLSLVGRYPSLSTKFANQVFVLLARCTGMGVSPRSDGQTQLHVRTVVRALGSVLVAHSSMVTPRGEGFKFTLSQHESPLTRGAGKRLRPRSMVSTALASPRPFVRFPC